MKYLGIDYGAKRVGIAVSDDGGRFAFPLKVLDGSENLIKELIKLCRENGVEEIVVGESKNYLQKDNEIMNEIVPLVKNLKDTLNLPIHMHPEFLTSQEAERLQGKNDMHDASAAALILRHFLDLKK